MKSKEFDISVSCAFGIPEKTITVYTRFLKEAGLLTTGARGVNAPDMTPLDAARVTIALLTCSGPSQAVERVRRFGPVPFLSNYALCANGVPNTGEEQFNEIFEGETLEEVLVFIFGRTKELGVEGALRWFRSNQFSIEISDSVLNPNITKAKHGITTKRSIASARLSAIAFDLKEVGE